MDAGDPLERDAEALEGGEDQEVVRRTPPGKYLKLCLAILKMSVF